MVTVALAFAVLGIDGSASSIGIVLAARTGAQLVCLLIGGVVADRVSRRAIMVAADISRLVTQGVLATIVIAGTAEVWSVALLAGLGGAASGFFSPASTGLLPDDRRAGAAPAGQRRAGDRDVGGRDRRPVLAGVLVAAVGRRLGAGGRRGHLRRQRAAARGGARARAREAGGGLAVDGVPRGLDDLPRHHLGVDVRGCGRRSRTSPGARGACSGRSWPRTSWAAPPPGARSTPRSASARCSGALGAIRQMPRRPRPRGRADRLHAGPRDRAARRRRARAGRGPRRARLRRRHDVRQRGLGVRAAAPHPPGCRSRA